MNIQLRKLRVLPTHSLVGDSAFLPGLLTLECRCIIQVTSRQIVSGRIVAVSLVPGSVPNRTYVRRFARSKNV